MLTNGFFSYLFLKVGKGIDVATTTIKKYSTLMLVLATIALTFVIIHHVTEIASYFGVQTRAQLKEELLTNKKELKKTIEVAKELEQGILRESISIKLLDGAINNKIEEEVKLDKVVEKVVTDHKVSTDKVVAIKKVTKVPYTNEEINKVAKINIDAIWDTYNQVKNI